MTAQATTQERIRHGRYEYERSGLARLAERWPFRTFARADAQPMPKGKPQQLRFAMIPTSWTFRRGSRIRLAIAGADADHYAQVPHGRLWVADGLGLRSYLP